MERHDRAWRDRRDCAWHLYLARRREYRGGVWLLAEVDLSRIETRAVRLNISLPAQLLLQIDAWAGANHMSRSGFLAKAAH